MRFEPGHAETLPFSDASFDRVVSVVAFHHMEDQERALAEMCRVLRPGGRLVIVELAKARAPGPVTRWLAGVRHAEHLSFFDPAELAAKLEMHGFHSVTMREGAACYFVAASR